MTPRLTNIWKKRANQVVAYITANPGTTGKEISYNTGVALKTVHLIIQHDPRAFALARDGKVAVMDRNIKPGWYHPSMTLVPLVKRDRLDPSVEFKDMLDEQNIDPNVRKRLDTVVDMVSQGIVNPARSVAKRRKEAVAIVSTAQTLGLGYTELKTQVDSIVPRLAKMEKTLLALTVRESLDNRYGKADLRKAGRS